MFFSYCRLSIKKYTKGRELSMTSCCLVFVDFDSKSSIPKCIHDLVTSGSNVALLPPWLPKKWAVRPIID